MSVAAHKFRRPKAKAPKTTWREGALVIFVRDGHCHVRGTVRHAGRKRRVRGSLGIPYSPANLDMAKATARGLEQDVRGELGGGVAPRSVAETALDFMARPKGERLGATDVAVIQELTAKFGMRRMRDIAPAEIISFVDDRMRGNAASTRERLLNTIVAFLNAAIAKGQYAAMPMFKRDKKARNPNRRARRRVTSIRPYLIQLLIESSHLAIGAQICAEAATGGRVSSVLFGCALEDLVMANDGMQLTFHDTKNDDDVIAALPEFDPLAAGNLPRLASAAGRCRPRERGAHRAAVFDAARLSLQTEREFHRHAQQNWLQ